MCLGCDVLDRKTGATAATGRGVWILDCETRADQLLCKINRRIGQKGERYLVNHHLLTFAFQNQVAVGGVIEVYVVLKPRTAAT